MAGDFALVLWNFFHHHSGYLLLFFTMKLLALVALVALLGVVIGDRTLVVVDDLSVKDTHSIFFKSLTGIDCAHHHHHSVPPLTSA